MYVLLSLQTVSIFGVTVSVLQVDMVWQKSVFIMAKLVIGGSGTLLICTAKLKAPSKNGLEKGVISKALAVTKLVSSPKQVLYVPTAVAVRSLAHQYGFSLLSSLES